jgi:hypothetical protein
MTNNIIQKTYLNFPLPPFSDSYEDNAVIAGEPVKIVLTEGRTVLGAINNFDSIDEMATVVEKNEKSQTRIKFQDIKLVIISRPRKWKKTDMLKYAEGYGLSIAGGVKEFSVVFKDGTKQSGKVFSFQSDRSGLYLFPVADEEHYSIMFIPHHNIQTSSVGQPIGKILVDDKVIKEDDLKHALEEQVHQRNQPIGEYLRNNAAALGRNSRRFLISRRKCLQ